MQFLMLPRFPRPLGIFSSATAEYRTRLVRYYYYYYITTWPFSNEYTTASHRISCIDRHNVRTYEYSHAC
jgi:hypothetical protein